MSTHTMLVKLDDGREVCLSYGVPVAAFIPGHGYVRTERRYSVTTSKHANAYAGRESKTMPDTLFRGLISPVTGDRC